MPRFVSRRHRLNGLFAPPLALTQTDTGPALAADRFEAFPAGSSMLLRVHVDGPVPPGETLLILDDAAGFDVVRPLAGPADAGAIGFALPAQRVGAGSRFWLEVRGRALRLGAPEMLTA